MSGLGRRADIRGGQGQGPTNAPQICFALHPNADFRTANPEGAFAHPETGDPSQMQISASGGFQEGALSEGNRR